MITAFLRKLLQLDENEKQIEKIKKKTEIQSRQTVTLMKQNSDKMIKTQTYYFGRALGVIIKSRI